MATTAAKNKRRKLSSNEKAQAQYKHARKRAWERYGLELNRTKYDNLCKQIRDGKGTCLGKQSNRLTVWSIVTDQVTDFGDPGQVTANVVYDKERHTIVTFLPPGITDAKGVAIPEIADAVR